jgi:hypothetical protein
MEETEYPKNGKGKLIKYKGWSFSYFLIENGKERQVNFLEFIKAKNESTKNISA